MLNPVLKTSLDQLIPVVAVIIDVQLKERNKPQEDSQSLIM